MLILNPRRVEFGGEPWERVSSVVVDRKAAKEVVEWSDLGPHVALADVPEQRVGVKVTQELARDELGGPGLGLMAELVMHTSPAGSDAGRARVSMSAVVVGVTHEVSVKRGAVRTIALVAVSADGAQDPVTVSPAEGA